MDIRKVKKLIEMLEESEVAEIEIHEGEESVRISRASSVVTAQAVMQVPPQPASITVPVTSTAEVAPPAAEAKEEPEGHIVRSPMVGIFFEAPSPGKPPFVELGKSVAKGEVLCILEAMKIMNQIEADISGVISKIMVENGEPVEYGQSLFVIKE